MAAAIHALNNYLDEPIGITAAPTRLVLNQQGLQSFDDFLTLTEKDIENICSNLRKPGGTLPNPAHNPANPVAGVAATIPNPGISLGHIYEKRMKMLRYYLLHLQRIQHPMTPASATLARLITCYAMKEAEDEEEEPDLPEKLTKIDKARDILDNIDNYLHRTSGSSGLPLAYVVRTDVALPLVDLGYGLPTANEEMIQRGPHTGPYYQLDNKAVWQIIRHCTHGGPAWSWVQGYQQAADGRGSYLALKTHYLGEAYSSRIRAAADNTIDSAYYDGKSRSFTFEKYCEVLKAAFTDIEVAGETVTDTRKVRVLLHGIKDKRLDTAIAQVMATDAIRATFESALNFIARFADEMKSLDTTNRAQQMRNVSTIASGRGRGGRQGTSGRGVRGGGRFKPKAAPGRGQAKIEDRYYPYEEWTKLTPEQQQKVRELKANREKKRSASSAESTRPAKAQTETDTRTSEVGSMMSTRKAATNRDL